MNTEAAELQAGPALDKAVALAIGWRLVPDYHPDHVVNSKSWYDSAGNVHGNEHDGVPPYSTGIAVAWRVVEHLRGLGYSFQLSSVGGDHARWCTFWGGPHGSYFPKEGVTCNAGPVEGDNGSEMQALAICRAALTVINSQEPVALP